MHTVLNFTPDNFHRALATDECPVSLVAADTHVQYLVRYLTSVDVGAKSMVLEDEYVDRDYLEDYAAFYVSCFYEYRRFCKRLHLFNEALDQQQFLKLARGEAMNDELASFQGAYLGFIVVRPLPDAFIGRTQLRTYLRDGGRRHYTAVRDYDVVLAGLNLTVRSMAFQEQDRAVAACATVALWSAFQKTSNLFGTAAPRPPVITAAATLPLIHRRALPSNGLSSNQICAAIRAADLEPEVFPKGAITPSLIYGYLRFGIPILLLVTIEGHPDGHAITLNGFSVVDAPLGDEQIYDAGDLYKSMPMVGRRINEFYGHDDQIGPFCRLWVKMPTAAGEPFSLTGEWKVPDNSRVATISPILVIAPVYRKIRLSFEDCRIAIFPIILFAQRVAEKSGYGREQCEWDIHLVTTSEYKRDIRGNPHLSQARRDYLLSASQPRYFWRCTLNVLKLPVMECGVDATEFSKSNPVFLINHFSVPFSQDFSTLAAATPDQKGYHPRLRDTLLNEYTVTKRKSS